MSIKKDEKPKSATPTTIPVLRPPNFFKPNKFGGNTRPSGGARFNPGTFKTQHKG